MDIGSTAEPPVNGALNAEVSPEISDVLMALWRKRRPEVVADLEQLVVFLTELDQQAADADVHDRAVALAHQLHGVFGIFGWHDLKSQLGHVEQGLISAKPNINQLIIAVRWVASNLP